MADDSEQNDVEEILVREDSTDPNDAQAAACAAPLRCSDACHGQQRGERGCTSGNGANGV